MGLEEDLGELGDLTTLATIPEDELATATYLSKADGTFAGRGVAEVVIRTVDPDLKVTWSVDEGAAVSKGQVLGTLAGRARSILVAERLSLNFMQRMSGVATATRAMAEAARPARVLETRKTIPGLRLLDKWAVVMGGEWPAPARAPAAGARPGAPVGGALEGPVGGALEGPPAVALLAGGENHRMGLYDMVMIKDNHVSAAGGLTQALTRVDGYLAARGLATPIEAETRTLEEVDEVLAYLRAHPGTRVRRIMLDNMTKRTGAGDELDVSMLREAVARVGGRCETEASGNITIGTVGQIGQTGVTFLSSGALTHSVTAFDISLLIDQGNYREH